MAAERFEEWAILELMGHRRLAGLVTEVEVAGQGMLRLEVPGEILSQEGLYRCQHGSTVRIGLAHGGGFGEQLPDADCERASESDGCQWGLVEQYTEAIGMVSQFYSPSAVYCITPTTEMLARQFARRHRPAPVHRFELPPALDDRPLFNDVPEAYAEVEEAELA